MQVLELSGEKVTVTPYSEQYDAMTDIPIATVVTVWENPKNGEAWMLVIHEALYFGNKLQESLLCPNQLRAAGNIVRDVPTQFDKTSSHSITVPGTLEIPLEMHGVISYLDTRLPTAEELEQYRAGQFQSVELTDNTPWEPYSETFAKREVKARSAAAVASPRTKQPVGLEHEAGEMMQPRRPFNLSGEERCIAVVNRLASRREPVEFSEEDLATRLIAAVNVTVQDSEGDGLYERSEDSASPATAEDREVFAMSSAQRGPVITKEILAKRWGIGLDTAHRTLTATTQVGIRRVLHPVERRYKTRQSHLRYPTLNTRFYTDTMYASTKSLKGNTCAQVFTNGTGYDLFYPLKKESLASEALTEVIRSIGIPKELVSDGAKAETQGDFGNIVREYKIKPTTTEPYSEWQNRAEAAVREIKRGLKRTMQRTRTPKRLWDYCGEWVAAVRRLTAHDLPGLDGRVPDEVVKGNTPDIAEYAQFDWYQYVWCHDPAVQFPNDQRRLARWIGVAHSVGNPMTFWVLPSTCKVLARSTVWSLTEDERQNPAIQAQMAELDASIREKVGDLVPDDEVDGELLGINPEIPDDIFLEEHEDEFEPAEPGSAMPEADDFTPEAYDEYLTAEVLLPNMGEVTRAKVVGRKRDADGNPIGLRNTNPILDTREYEVEFPDGATNVFTANMIAESMYSQVDSDGHTFAIMSEIIDHKSDGTAVSKDDGFEAYGQGQRRPKRTTRGWKLLVSWKDGSTSWVPLKDLKESHPVQVAEYALVNKILEEPAFAWWATWVLRKRDRIIKKVKSRYWMRTHKYGILLPKSVSEALRVDKETGTDFWAKAIAKEMKAIDHAFEFTDDDKMPVGYQKIDCHMVFDVKITLDRKARYVAGGHQTEPTKDMTFASVVSRDSIRIAFLVAALNDLEILSADVAGAYLNAKAKEKVYTTAGKEFGPDKEGRPVIITRALYGLRSSGRAWRDHMAATLRDFGYSSCKADPDVWMRPKTKPDGFQYWSYILVYTDDLLVVDHEPKVVMDYMASRYTLKPGSVKEPEFYLGTQVTKFRIDGADDPDKPRWAMSSEAYIKQAVADVETELAKVDKCLPTRVTTPVSQGYRPEVDQSRELDAQRGQYYQSLIGVLRWICELGRLDIMVPVSMLSRYVVSPREGHLQQVFHIFAYMKHHKRSRMVFDDTEPVFDESSFKVCDWSDFYPDAEEAIPHDAPMVRGNGVVTSCFVDADHAGCKATRRSHTGVILFVNKAPIMWYSKRQNTVETSTFGSEFCAMKTAIDMIEGLRYKLRMLGIPLTGATSVFCDNESVVKNSTAPESTLKKRHNAIAYHRAREAQAAGIIRVAWESGDTQIGDLLTKLMPGPRLKELIGYVLW
jgi:predicted hotdog family 3-hydroxylacyl-ACP dehydratase